MNSLQDVLDPLSGPVPARNRRRNPFWRFRRFLFVIVLMAVVGSGTVLYVFSQTELPEDRFGELALTTYICTAEVKAGCGPENAAAQLSEAAEDRELVTYEDLPDHVVQAIVATEDQDFFIHYGVDPRGISRAAYQYVRNPDGLVQGGSTITQQYVKLAFNDDDQTLTRKAREAIRAVKLEQELSAECADRPDLDELGITPKQCAKEEILTRYLNRAYFGRGASGIQSASRAYFGKDVQEVTVAEAAFLAGLLRNPNGADPIDDPEEANRRRTVTLELMLTAGYLSETDAVAANESQWQVVPRPDREGLGDVLGAEYGTEYFIEEVRLQVEQALPGQIYTGGLRVYTTLDRGLQQMAYESAHAPKDEDLSTRDFPEMGPLFLDPANPDDPDAAIVSIDGAGRVVAMVAGTDFEQSEFNLATSSGTAGRQPGSTFKTLGLALAIESGISAKSFYPAVPGVTKIGDPCRSNGEDWQVTGGSSARYRHRDLVDALRWSSNVVFAQLVVQLDPRSLMNFAEDMGVTSDLSIPLAGGQSTAPCSLILGSQGVPVIDMASVYSVFERDGLRLDPVIIERITDSEGNILCWYPVNGICQDGPEDRVGTQVIDPETARQVNYALSQVVEGGTGRRANFDPERAIAGKTGTSQESRDGWFAGLTCGLTTVVWMGHAGEEIPMVDFRKPLAEGETERQVRDDNGNVIDDRGWPNIEGGNFPTMIWADYMAKATATMPPCPELNVSQDFTGTRLNQDLSTTTLPPCGVELDQFGYPRGDPENWVFITTTTAAPPPSSGGEGEPEGLPVQQPDGGQGAEGEAALCVPPEVWILQSDPTATIPTQTIPPETTTPETTETTLPPSSDTTDTTAPPTSPTVTEPPTTETTLPPSSDTTETTAAAASPEPPPAPPPED